MTGDALQYYAVLGIPATASVEAIKARYRTLLVEARSKIGSRQIDVQAITRLREAYLALTDPQQRARHDHDAAPCADGPKKHILRLVDMDVGEVCA